MITPTQRSIRKITVELDIVTHPSLRDLFTRPAAAKELEPFLRGINVAWTAKNSNGEITEIELTGPPDRLNDFRLNVLGDEHGNVYSES